MIDHPTTDAADVPDGYAPFPEHGLASMGRWHDRMSATSTTTMGRKIHAQYATICREAMRSHAAVRERALTAELQVRQLLHPQRASRHDR